MTLSNVLSIGNEKYPVFSGSITKNLPEIKQKGLEILTTEEVMRLRVEHEEEIGFGYKVLKENTFKTRSSIVFNGDGEIIVDPGSGRILEDQKYLQRGAFGALLYEEGKFEKTLGRSLNLNELPNNGPYYGYSFDEKESAISNKMWQAITKGDTELLGKYFDWSEQNIGTFDQCDHIMPVRIVKGKGKKVKFGQEFICTLVGSHDHSYAMTGIQTKGIDWERGYIITKS